MRHLKHNEEAGGMSSCGQRSVSQWLDNYCFLERCVNDSNQPSHSRRVFSLMAGREV